MHLEIDLRFDATRGAAEGANADRLDLNTLTQEARSPIRLWRLLRKTSYTEVSVIEGGLPLSAVQAAFLIVVAAIPTRRFAVGGRELGRAAFLRRALAAAAMAVPAELLRSAVLIVRVWRSSRRRSELPRRVASATRALYLRVDPTLDWMGLQVGGAATHTTGVINGLLDNGVAVEILAAERPAGTDRACFVRVPVKRVLQLVPGLSMAGYGEEVLRAGLGLSADFVYQRCQLGSDVGLRLAERIKVPLVLEFNGSELWIERHWFSGHVRFGHIFDRLERCNLRNASLVVVVSDALRESVIADGVKPERVLVNPNGVDIDALEPYRARTAAEWRRHLGLPDEPTVGFIGTFGPWHGVKLLPALAAAVPNARWVVIGDGPLFPEVNNEMSARQLDNRVTMTGLLARPRALEKLACCDVCVSPHVPNADGTKFFGSPTKIVEYMGLRKAIVASDLGQIGELLTHEQTALLCTPGDIDEAAASVRRLLADPTLRDHLAMAAFELVASKYTWTAHVRRIIDALVAGPRPDDQTQLGSVKL